MAKFKYFKKGFVLWFTGLSGAGKTTIALLVLKKLQKMGYAIELLDGDEVRKVIARDLGYTREDRRTNLERTAYIAQLLSRNNIGVIASFVSPFRKDRDVVKNTVTNYIDVYVDTPLSVCEKRDVKGLYKKARKGEIALFTGVSDPYEPPIKPDIVLRGDKRGREVDRLAMEVVKYLIKKKFI